MNQNQTQEQNIVLENQVQNLKKSLLKSNFIDRPILKYQGFWCFEHLITNVIAFQTQFHARDSDIFITSIPKTGSTWLKSLLFSIVNRSTKHTQNPLLVNHPQELVYSLETDVYGNAFAYPRPHHLDELPSPRLLSTHLPYASLPESIKGSNCRVLYIARNPFDTLVSLYYFSTGARNKYFSKDLIKRFIGMFSHFPSMDDFFEAFCEEKTPFGPFFDHVIGYWKASIEEPNKVLFVKYEDMKEDATHELKRIAQFVGMPFTTQEENEGVIEEIIKMCSIKNMKELEVNKNGVINELFEKKSYFRKGEVGDWTHHFTPPMIEKMKKLMDEKLQGTGLSFKLSH